MADWNPRANDIFVRSLEVDDPGGRRDFIDQACQGDATLRAEVERLLASLEKAGDFLQSRDERGSEPIREGPPYAKMPFPPGSLLAERYRVRQPLGEGGMGVVLLADQIRPVRRPVAIKLMKHGRDIWQIAARFDQERNALALMDHPHIAKVFDAGVVDIATGEEIKSEASGARRWFAVESPILSWNTSTVRPSPDTATSIDCRPCSDWNCSFRFVKPSNTHIKRASFIET